MIFSGFLLNEGFYLFHPYYQAKSSQKSLLHLHQLIWYVSLKRLFKCFSSLTKYFIFITKITLYPTIYASLLATAVAESIVFLGCWFWATLWATLQKVYVSRQTVDIHNSYRLSANDFSDPTYPSGQNVNTGVYALILSSLPTQRSRGLLSFL